MNTVLRDRLLGLVLSVIAIAWSAIVYLTIPSGGSDGAIGPRAFPLILGIALLALSALLLLRSLRGSGDGAREASLMDVAEDERRISADEIRVAGGVFLLLIAYGVLMEKVGFLLATPPVIALVMAGLPGQRKPLFVIGLALALTAACWGIFGKLLGVYLPQGSWISLEAFV
ncbi:MAG: tripartite tricarboxylate transporter TctB family protein [Rhodomicrobiaceae bacterium]